MRKRKTLSLRVSAEFKKKLVEEAKREKRSVTSYIEVMLGKLWEEGEARNKQ
jgi:predicted HicB family RNase H-like nuclease